MKRERERERERERGGAEHKSKKQINDYVTALRVAILTIATIRFIELFHRTNLLNNVRSPNYCLLQL